MSSTIAEAADQKNFCLKKEFGKIHLDKSHTYYFPSSGPDIYLWG